jgi:hypothetical protein
MQKFPYREKVEIKFTMQAHRNIEKHSYQDYLKIP